MIKVKESHQVEAEKATPWWNESWQYRKNITIDPDANEPEYCRMWGIISDSVPDDVIENHLIHDLYSIKNLSTDNRDGWGIIY